jgi:hypothetical protein
MAAQQQKIVSLVSKHGFREAYDFSKALESYFQDGWVVASFSSTADPSTKDEAAYTVIITVLLEKPTVMTAQVL